jgi:Kef-type K+ transport system membrane component KefB
MDLWLTALRVAAGLNIVLLAVLSYLWGRNFRQFRSKHTAGLSAFAAILLVENVATLYLFAFHPVLTPWIAGIALPAQQTLTILKLLEAAALAVLTYVTLD